MMRELKTNKKFEELIPPLNAEEYAELYQSITMEGCRDAIILWNNTIVDGHNRYGICKKLDIPFNTLEKDFDDEDTALEWIMRNQFARRNLIDVERGRLALKLKNMIAERAKLNQGTRTDICPNLDKCSQDDFVPIDTKKELAKISGLSHGTLAKIEKVDNEAPAIIREAMGKTISIDKAAKLNSILRETPEDEWEDEEDILFLAELKEKEKRIYYEEKVIKKLHNILSAAIIDYEYITAESVAIYMKKSPVPAWDVAESIDRAIEWLFKLKDMFQAESLERDEIKDRKY
ncbi:MAG: hypothetical protein FWC80_05355 [Firmicutes bacterium]|nr:hypothetical protein [Bacillota bacterium]